MLPETVRRAGTTGVSGTVFPHGAELERTWFHVAATVASVDPSVCGMDLCRIIFRQPDISRVQIFRGPNPPRNYSEAQSGRLVPVGLLAPGIIWLGRRFPLEREHWARSTVMHLIAGVGIALLKWWLGNLFRRYVL